jgi:hypothetical protein
MLIEILLSILGLWIAIKVFKLLLKLAWGAAKIIASVLLVLALPLLVVGLVFAGGFVMLIPVAMVAAAFGILKTCL